MQAPSETRLDPISRARSPDVREVPERASTVWSSTGEEILTLSV
jgi:hypothetical protein